MRPNAARLRIEKIIVHDVPRTSDKEDDGPRLSQVDSPINTELRNFFQERIRASLGAAAFDVVFDENTESPAPDLVFDQLGDESRSYVDMSVELAQHLYSVQTKVNSPGLLAVIRGTIDNSSCLAVLKVEREAGVRLQEIEQSGMRTFNMTHIRDLMLTDKTKVFKAGLFVQNGDNKESIVGLLSDHQRGKNPRIEVATFFISLFLGCRLRDAPGVTTKRFFHEVQEFINSEVEDPHTKADYLSALITTMKSNASTIDPYHFAGDNFRGQDRGKLLSHLEAAQVPKRQIEKDTSLIEAALRRTRYVFDSGLSLMGPAESFDRHVEIIKLGEDESRTEIRDRLKDVQAR